MVLQKFIASFLFVVWQHPYVNIFKHYNISEWKKCAKEGEVTAVMVGFLDLKLCLKLVA